MKKALKWMAIAVLTPILLFLILAALLYFPPVQNWAVKKVAAIASEKTGMEITVGHVNLEWPFDLGIDDFRMLHPNDSLPNVTDTIADIGHLTADIQLWPLLEKRVVIDELSMREAKLNTNGFIGDLRIKGWMKELWLSSKGIDLDKETVEVNGARLVKADLDIQLSDTAAVDTTTSDNKWIINADSLSIHQTRLAIHLPGDTLHVDAYMGHAVATEANIDLGKEIYKVSSLKWNDGKLSYDNRFEPNVSGFDANHIALSHIYLGIDSISYTPQGTSFYVHNTSFKEKCGIEIAKLEGGVRLDSAFNKIEIPALSLRTPDSDIYTEVDMDFSAFDDKNPGKMKMRLNAQLGKQDLMRFLGDMPASFIRSYPNHPIAIKGSLNGNMKQMEFTGLDINLPTAFHISASGTVGHLTDMSRLQADLKMNAKTQDIGFVTTLLDPKTMRDYRIPNGITLDGTLKANGPRYTADLVAREGQGTVKLKGNATVPLNAKGEMVPNQMSYDADISISNLNLHHFMPKDSIYNLSADISAKGYGTDILSNSTRLTADATLHQLQYGSWNLNNMSAKATISNGRSHATITGQNALFNGDITADMLLAPALSKEHAIEAQLCADLSKADLFQMRITDEPLTIGLIGDLSIKSNLKETHYVSGLIDNISIQDKKTTYYPTKVGLLLKTDRDTTYVRMQSGDFIVKLDAQGGYERVLKQLTTITDSVIAQYEARVIDQPAIKRLLPTMKLHVESKRDNPIANLLKTQEIDFKDLLLDVNMSPETGINGSSHLYSLNYDSTRIDTIHLNLTQRGDRLTYQAQICNNRRNPQFVFNALIDGHVHEHGALAGLRYYDKDGKMGVRIGATAEMESGGIRFKLMPDRPTIGYKEFNLNKDNFVFLGNNKKIQAKVDLIADDRTGLKLYTENQDSTMLQDLTLSCNRIDLGEITSVMPYLPKITGKLNGDYHILQDQNEQFSLVSEMAIQDMTYEGALIGNLSTEFVYLMKEDDTHAIEAHLMLNDEEFGTLSGNYQNKDEGHIDATFNMTRFPLSLVNGLIEDQIVGLEGYAEGELAIKGTLNHPQINGELYVEDAYLVSLPYGIRMRFDNDPVRIIDSRLLLENFGLYAYNDEPINMMGNIDFSDMDRITMDMRMRARNLLLINSKQEAKSIAFGKAYVNFVARMQGPLEQLDMRGRLDVLSSTDMTYMLLDSPLSTDNRLDELVKFTDFSDSTQTVVVKPVPTGLNADLTISVAQGAHIVCDLNIEQTNYIDLMGSGDLRMKYNNEGINLTGRYTLNRGEMKYSLPVIPLRTFTIKDGSYVEFTGDAMNPKLNITATEHVKASVGGEGTTRVVAFECGVIITNTLNQMGVQFIIDAPEDNLINGDLNSMSAEERSKVAVAMLTTGMYLADSNTSGFSMNAALSSFLQSEINNIAGSALKTLDLSVGIDNTTDASGSMQTDYSFKFAKRFFDNRLKIEIGGVVSSGNNTPQGQKQSFFDNVSMEYRMNQSGTMNAKLFYQQNVYDWLDGYTNMFGGGFLWRRKLSNFWDILRFWKKEEQPMRRINLEQQPGQTLRRDSTATDSLKVKK
jgi:autotransporter translocation and assembly factor TamB